MKKLRKIIGWTLIVGPVLTVIGVAFYDDPLMTLAKLGLGLIIMFIIYGGYLLVTD